MNEKEYKEKFKKAYDDAREALEKVYRLTDESNPALTNFWMIRSILKNLYDQEMKQ